MVEIATARVSAKRQIVIPSSLNWNIVEGDTLIFVRDNDQVIVKKASDMDRMLGEDKDFSQRIRKAWEEVDEGRVTEYTAEGFLAELKKR